MKSTSKTTVDECNHSCEAVSGRRAFLREGLMAVAALTVVAGTSAPLHALERRYFKGLAYGSSLKYPLPEVDGATIDAENSIIIVRYENKVHAFSLKCTHRGENIEWQADNNVFFCPKHKSTFKAEGSLLKGPAKRGMDRYSISLEEGQIVVDTAALIDGSTHPEEWEAAGISV